MKEAKLIVEALEMLNDPQTGARAWRNNTGKAFYKHRMVTYGLAVGSSDIIGYTAEGRFLACEVKTKGTRWTDPQLAFLQAVKDIGGCALIYTEDGFQDYE